MQFTVFSPGPLTGRVKLPGDLRLTLTLISLGVLTGEQISIIYPSSAQAVRNMRKFLERYNVSFEDFENGFSLKGKFFTGHRGPGVPV